MAGQRTVVGVLSLLASSAVSFTALLGVECPAPPASPLGAQLAALRGLRLAEEDVEGAPTANDFL